MKQYGFIKPQITDDNYILGSSPLKSEILQEDGQWGAYLPEVEIQRQNNLETMNCTVYGTLNALEIILDRKYNIKSNFSERFLGVLSATSKEGNDPHRVIETARKSGLIDELLLPFSRDITTWEQYYSPNPMENALLVEGAKFLQQYVLGHEWVFNGGKTKDKQNKIKEALKSSPVGASVYAWKRKGQYYIKPKGQQDNHWITIYGYKDKKYWLVFDHYDDSYKKLVWDYDFGFAKRYTIDINTNPQKATDIFKNVFNAVSEMIHNVLYNVFNEKDIDWKTKENMWYETQKKLDIIKNTPPKQKEDATQTLLRLAKENLGRDVTPDDKIPDEVACAESLSTIIKTIDPTFPILPYTLHLYRELEKNKRFEKSLEIKPGYIIISPTEMGNKGAIGHCGIFLNDLKIASNRSKTGLWEATHTLDQWVKYYRTDRGFPLFIFKMI